MDVDRYVASAAAGRVDLALADPPYAFDGWAGLLDAVPAAVLGRRIRPGRRAAPIAGWELVRSRRYGTTHVTILRRIRRPERSGQGSHGGASDQNGERRRRHDGRPPRRPGSLTAPRRTGVAPCRPSSTRGASIPSTTATSTWSSRPARLFGAVIVATMHNPEKPGGLFTLDERKAMIEEPSPTCPTSRSGVYAGWPSTRRGPPAPTSS